MSLDGCDVCLIVVALRYKKNTNNNTNIRFAFLFWYKWYKNLCHVHFPLRVWMECLCARRGESNKNGRAVQEKKNRIAKIDLVILNMMCFFLLLL